MKTAKTTKTSSKSETTENAKSTKTTKTEQTNDVVRDEFGARKGARTFTINAVLLAAKEPLSVKEITDKTGCKAVGNHMQTMRLKGHFTRTDSGWILTSKLQPKKPAKKSKKSA